MRWRDLVVSGSAAGFTRMEGWRSGFRFQNEVSDSLLLGNRFLGQGAGVALGDVDGDGLVDVFIGRTQGCSALFRNLGNWRFENVAERAGTTLCDRNTTAAAFADVDGDGDLDLIVLATRGPNAVFLNDGTGKFTEHRDLGLDSTGHGGTTLTLADVNGDGRLDMYVANYKAYNFDDSVPPQQRPFNRMVREVVPGRFEIVPEFRREYRIVNRPDMGGLRLSARGEADELYVNEGGRFRPVSFASAFRDASGAPMAADPESFTLSAKFVDLNADGSPDLYVANDFEDPNQLWFNDGHGAFRLAPWTAQRQTSNSTMGIDAADVNGDGLPDIFEVDMLANDSHRLKTEIPTHTPLPKRAGDIETQLQQQRNSLFLNRGDETFAEVATYAGVQASGWSWSTLLLDVDLDGRRDILVANGHPWDIMDADTQERLQSRPPDFSWQRLRWQFPPLKLKNVAFRNRGNLTFEDAGAAWRFGTEDDISHTMAAADLDGDGDLDVVVNRLGAPALLLRNDSPAARVAVRLVGAAPNTHAVGAKIKLLGGAVPLQLQEVQAGGIYMSHSDYLASFAMGAATRATLEIEWRDGRRTAIADVRPNRLYEITEPATAAVARVDSAPRSAPAPLFEDASAQLGGHTHVESPFDDWGRQYLLPNALSQLGPGVVWFDVDGDGDDDLIVGAGRGGHLGVFRNERGRLVPARPEGPAAGADFTGLAALVESGRRRLLIGQSSWEGESTPAVSSLELGGGSRAGNALTPVVASRGSSTGPIALGDYDGDGDLDLFVGGRVVPGRYPVATASALYRNDGGTFVLDSSNAGPLSDVGLVSAALFADMNGDGRPELILAREWDSILLLVNNGGKYTPAAPASGLARWTSRWNGLAAGDLDGDGLLDLVATSWGRNTIATADTAQPLVMLHGPFGSAGEEEMLLARMDARLHDLAPLNGYGRVRVALRDLAARIGSFAAYADAPVSAVLGADMARAQRREIVTLDHMLFLNRGDHFTAVPLPAEAQLAPAFYAGIADFDGDGNEDILLTQNFFPTAMGLPRFDAGRGLLLAGDGMGRLRPVQGATSGILVYGDQRGAAYSDYDADGRIDVAISQNGAATRLLHNRGAKPGLRVRLQGSPNNPSAVGAQLRIMYASRAGPVREVHAGSGYWSQNSSVQVFGLNGTPAAVWVRWPGGKESIVRLRPGAREVTIVEEGGGRKGEGG